MTLTITDWLLALLCLLCTAALAAMVAPRWRLPVGIGLLGAAALFLLPSSLLGQLIGEAWLGRLEAWARLTPLPLAQWVHLLLFAVLGLLLWGRHRYLRGRAGAVLLALLALGAEAAQFLSRGREPHWDDAGYNLLGAALGVLLASALQRLRPRQDRPSAAGR